MDSDYGSVQGVGFENALTVLTSVVSIQRAERRRSSTPATRRSAATPAPPRPRDVDATYAFMGDEHGKLTFESGCPLRARRHAWS